MQRSFLIFAVAFVAMMAGALFYAARLPVSAPGGAPAPEPAAPADTGAGYAPTPVAFTLTDIDGEPRDASEWDGSHRILNFWATWCAPCRREIPLLKAFQEEHGADGLQVIGIAVDFMEPVIEYAEAAEFNYPILVGEQDAMAVAEASGVDFIGLPFTMFVDRDGGLVGTHMGEIHEDQLAEVARVLKELDAGTLGHEAAATALNSL